VDTVRSEVIGVRSAWAQPGRQPGFVLKLTGVLREAGLTVKWRLEYSSSHQATAVALLRCYRADSLQVAAQFGTRATADLITSHRLWSDWLDSGRVRKFAMVAEEQ
jgi:hypothetical protein